MKKKMKKSLKTKIWSGLTLFFMLEVYFLVLVGINNANKNLEEAQNNQIRIQEAVVDFSDASKYLTDEIRAYAATGDKEHIENYEREVTKDKNREKNVAIVKEIGITKEEEKLLEEIAAVSDSLVPLEEEAAKYVEEKQLQKAYDIVYGKEYEDGVNEISQKIDKLEDIIKKRVAGIVEKQNDYFSSALGTTIIVITMTMFIQIYLIKIILAELLKPIQKFQDKMNLFAEGDIETPFDVEIDTSEVGLTAKAVHDFQAFQKSIIDDIHYLLSEMGNGNFRLKTRCEENYKGNYKNILLDMRHLNRVLSATLSEIDESAGQVNIGAEQISYMAQALSQGATEQAASVEELTTTIGNVSEQINEIAKNAGTANKNCHDAKDAIEQCDAKMKVMNDAMIQMETKSSEIHKIIKTIDDIAFQTNILALNAAVEAARAGAAGKGFGVVADEVRNLASKCAEAAARTSELIEETVGAITNGKAVALETADLLNIVIDTSSNANLSVNEISDATAMQTELMSQVVIGMDQINNVVQANSATSEESAAASEELSGQANSLKLLVDRFELRED